MTNRNQVISKLAQAILDVQQADGNAALTLVLARLSSDLDDLQVGKVENAALPVANRDPQLIQVENYFDQLGTNCPIPKGYKMFVALVTDLVWPQAFSITKGRPVYEASPNGSGAEFVDMWLARDPEVEPHPSTMEAFKALLLEDGYLVKTAKEFNQCTDTHSFVVRLMVHHEKFCKHQQIALPHQ